MKAVECFGCNYLRKGDDGSGNQVYYCECNKHVFTLEEISIGGVICPLKVQP